MYSYLSINWYPKLLVWLQLLLKWDRHKSVRETLFFAQLHIALRGNEKRTTKTKQNWTNKSEMFVQCNMQEIFVMRLNAFPCYYKVVNIMAVQIVSISSYI